VIQLRRVAALAANNAPKGATFLIVPVPATHVMSVVVVASMNLDRLRQVRQGSHWHGQGGRNQSKDNSRRQNCSAHGNLRFSRSGHYSEAPAEHHRTMIAQSSPTSVRLAPMTAYGTSRQFAALHQFGRNWR